nr:MAG TPA: hypothetical protein [Caudoviricetes sp.]
MWVRPHRQPKPPRLLSTQIPRRRSLPRLKLL